MTGSTPPFIWWIFIFLVTWIGFALDHLIDACKSTSPLLTKRHAFHKHHFKLILSICIGLSLSAFLLSLIIFDRAYMIFLALFSIGFFIHAILCHLNRLPSIKELRVGLLYTSVIWSYPIYLNHNDKWVTTLGLFLFFILALINLYWLSFFDYYVDKKQFFWGIGSHFNRRHLLKLIMGLNGLFLIVFLISICFFEPKIITIYLLMWIFLSGFILCKNKLLKLLIELAIFYSFS